MSINDVRNFSKEDVLQALGLEVRRSGFEVLLAGSAMFATGLAFGIGIGMLMAPKSGAQLRGELNDHYRRAVSGAREQMGQMSSMGAPRQTEA